MSRWLRPALLVVEAAPLSLLVLVVLYTVTGYQVFLSIFQVIPLPSSIHGDTF